MADLYLITSQEYPQRMIGSFQGYVIRPSEQRDIIAIEDRLHHQTGGNLQVPGQTLVILPDANLSKFLLEEQVTLAEFGMYVLTTSGAINFQYAATFSGPTCTQVWGLKEQKGADPAFTDTMGGESATKWLARCVLARSKLKSRFHITADRYVRYERAEIVSDGLLDLCICLESTLDAQTEIAFKFSIMLGRLAGGRGEDGDRVARVLQKLYELRSKIAHGDPEAAKALEKLQPELPELRRIARRIVTEYVLFTGDKTREEWRDHLRSTLFA
jgi:hypothetical protein